MIDIEEYNKVGMILLVIFIRQILYLISSLQSKVMRLLDGSHSGGS